MEFEQLNIDQQFVPELLHPDFKFSTIESSGNIYPVVDWCSILFTDCTLNHVFNWLKLDGLLSDFWDSMYEGHTFTFGVGYIFLYQGVRIECPKIYFYDSIDPSTGAVDVTPLFEKCVPQIRVDLSGQGLNYLRSIGVDFNTYRFVPPVLPDGATYHFTRIDFAFDFINCFPTFMDECINFCRENMLDSGRLPICNTHSGIKCRVVTGGEKTIYLGSSQSEKFLRIYDKRLEQIHKGTMTYVKPNPYNNPDSWFRLEWQLRKRACLALATDESVTFDQILKMIFNQYAFADGTVKYSRDRRPTDFWAKLLPWEQIETRIIQNAKYVQFKSPEQRLKEAFVRAAPSVIKFIATYGIEEADKVLSDYIKNLYVLENEHKLIRFINDLDILKCGSAIPHERSKWLFIDYGRLQWGGL